MKTICLLAVVISAMNLHSGDMLKLLECHDAVVRDGVATLTVAKEIESLFGATNVDHFISKFGSKSAIWNSVTYFFGRYTLSLRVPISIDYDNCKVNGVTDAAAIQINETIKVEISTSGIAGATEKGQWRLDENKWKRLVNSGGDWSVVGVAILTNSPVKGFDEFVRQKREPIRNRKEGFDNPIRQTLDALRKKSEKLPDVSDESNRGALSAVECHDKVVRQGVETLILPKEIESLFGATNVDYFISKFGSKTQTPVWHSVTYFAGRYRFLLQVPVLVDYQKCKLKGAIDSAVVQIDEITKVDISKPGLAGARTKGRWTLNENEWKWLVKNNGDWSVVKVPIQTNAPVKGFDEYVRRERGRPVRSRQEDFDKPIRQLIDAVPYPR
jgi:hypothetical protein